MKIVTFERNDEVKLGVMVTEGIVDLGGENAGIPTDMITLLQQGNAGMETIRSIISQNPPSVPLNEVTLLPPVLNPQKVIALGRNYAAHAAEGGAELPKYPMLFHKTAGSLLGAEGEIIIPPVTNKVDYEAELAVIIGKPCKNVSEETALAYVAGYCCANDVSARDWQRRTSQFSAGKMLDTFGPLGPALVTKDDVPDPQNLTIRSVLNGQTMQESNTSYMMFSVAFTISYISQIATLYPGDVILTGTPEGVGFARTPPVYLKSGDEITIEIERVGTLTNTVQ